MALGKVGHEACCAAALTANVYDRIITLGDEIAHFPFCYTEGVFSVINSGNKYRARQRRFYARRMLEKLGLPRACSTFW